MHMLSGADLPPLYRLPSPYASDQYYAAYKRANDQVASDLAAGKTDAGSIPFEPVEPLAASLVFDDVEVPNLEPLGTGEGDPQWISLRDRQIIYLWAHASDTIRIDVRHLAGQSRAIALQYVLLDAAKNVLRHETVGPGDTENIEVPAPRTGAYAFVVTGGSGGLAWYAVRVHNAHMALRCAPPAYIFYKNPCELWFTRAHPNDLATVTITTGRNQVFQARLNGGAEQFVDSAIRFDLPSDRDAHVVRITKPDPLPQGTYVQDLAVATEGAVEPYASDHPQRRMRTLH
jgi:hypothetical protein